VASPRVRDTFFSEGWDGKDGRSLFEGCEHVVVEIWVVDDDCNC
jgi:hypothetical protein